MPTSTSSGRRFDVPMIVAWIPSNGVRSRRSSDSGSTSYSRQFSSPPTSCTYSTCLPSRAQANARMPRSVSSVSGRAAAQSTPGSPPAGATHRFSTPSRGAIQASALPSGEICGLVRSGLPKSTLRGMRSTMRPCLPYERNWRSTGPFWLPAAVLSRGGATPVPPDSLPGRDPRTPRRKAAGRTFWMISELTSRYTLITVSGARTSLSGWLARMGFTDIPKAERELAALGITSEDHSLLASSAQAADPDLALAGLAQVAERDPGLIGALSADPELRARLCAVLGVSRAMADHLVRHPGDIAVLRGQEAGRRPDAKTVREEFLRAVAADPADAEPTAGTAERNTEQDTARADPVERLTAAYHRRLL